MKLVLVSDESELQRCWAILESAGRNIYDRFGLDHWYPPVPFEAFQERSKDKMVFLIQDALSLRMVGTVSLSTSEPYGTQAIWEDCPSRLVVSKLAVLPECQEQGIGTFALGECEVMARKMGFEKVVLDAVTRHELLLQFYVSRGYTRLRDIEILGVSGKPWLATLFEKAVG